MTKHETTSGEPPIKRDPYSQADLDADLAKLRTTYPGFTWGGGLRPPRGARIKGQSGTRPSFLVEAHVQETNTIKVDIFWRSMAFRPPALPHREGGVHRAIQQTFFAFEPQVRSIAKAFDVSLTRA